MFEGISNYICSLEETQGFFIFSDSIEQGLSDVQLKRAALLWMFHLKEALSNSPYPPLFLGNS